MIKKFPWVLNKALNLLKLLCRTAIKTWLQLRLSVAIYGLADLPGNNNFPLENCLFSLLWWPKLRNTLTCLNVYMGLLLLTACTRTKNAFLSLSLHPYLNGVCAGHGKKCKLKHNYSTTGYNIGKSFVRFQRFGFILTTSAAEHFGRSENLIMLFRVFQVLKQDFLYFTSEYIYHQTQLAREDKWKTKSRN